MTNNTPLYLDSIDAQSLGVTVSRDYSFVFLANNSNMPSMNVSNHQGQSLGDELARLILHPDSICFVITDILFYRFLLSVNMMFSIYGASEVSSLLISSSEKVFESMPRDEVWKLLDRPNVDLVESVLDEIVSEAKAEDDINAIPLLSKLRTIHTRLYGGNSDSVLSGFSKSASLVIPFSLYTNRAKINKVIGDAQKLAVINEKSLILKDHSDKIIVKGEVDEFESIYRFCDSICTVLKALFVDGMKDGNNDELYRRIWAFLLRTKSSCFLPTSAIDRAKELLL